MKKVLLIFVLVFFLTPMHAIAGDDLLNKVVLCTNVYLHNDGSKKIWLFWGIKFLPQQTFIMLDHDTQKDKFKNEYEVLNGTYSTSYNEIKLTLDIKYGEIFAKKFTINRTTLSMKNDDHYYELFEKSSCRVQEHIAITNERFYEFFELKLKEEYLKVDERKI